MTLKETIALLKAHSDPKNLAGMARFGIAVDNALGLSMPFIRKTARGIGANQLLAEELWDSGIHDARILAGCIAEADKFTMKLAEKWIAGFKSWDLCDQTCMNIFGDLSFSRKIIEKCRRAEAEFVKRTAFSLIAVLAVHDKEASDAEFEQFLEMIKEAASDNRNFVKKAVNWALRQIGKRNIHLNKKALETAAEIKASGTPSAKWIAADAIRELSSPAVLSRIKSKQALK